MMEEERIELNVPDIGQNEKVKKMREEEQKNDLREQKIAKENRRRAAMRTRRKKKIEKFIFAAGVVAIVGAGLTYAGKNVIQNINYSSNPIENTVSSIDDYINNGEKTESAVVEEYAEKYAALEQEIQYNEQSSNSKLSQVALDTQEKVDAQISKLADKMLEDFGSLSSDEVISSCLKRTDNKQSSFYDFSRYNKKSVTLNWLKKYFDYSQFEKVYDSLSEEEINALIAFTTYNCIDVYEGGPNNRETFLRNLGFTSDQSDEEKLAIAKKVANQTSFNVAKECLTQKLGYSLDIETESVGRGK